MKKIILLILTLALFSGDRFRQLGVENMVRGGGTTFTSSLSAIGVQIASNKVDSSAYEKINQIKLQIEKLKLQLSR